MGHITRSGILWRSDSGKVLVVVDKCFDEDYDRIIIQDEEKMEEVKVIQSLGDLDKNIREAKIYAEGYYKGQYEKL